MSGEPSNAFFHWADYLVFSMMLMLSCSIGIYHGVQDKRRTRNTVEDFLMAGRSMKVLPVSVSMFVSWVSAISFIGDPVEVYYHGISYWVIGVGYCFALPIVAHYFAPKYKDMGLQSAYEFLEKRYSRHIRLIVSVIQGISGGIFCGFVIYVPAICIAQVSGISVWISVIVLGVICVFYTTLGGMKAVLWTDTVQACLMFIGLVTVVIRGCVVVGGIGRVWDVAQATGRTHVDLTPNPFVRSSVWTYLIGGFAATLFPFVSVQPYIQRFGTLKTAKDAKVAVYAIIPMYAVFVSLFALLGLVMTAYFEGCDPLTSGRIERKDQIVPLLVVELFAFLPGFAGLYLASVFCASLSSISSYLNSLSMTLLMDIVEPLYTKHKRTPMSASLALRLSKVFCIVLGSVFVIFALMMSQLQNVTIFEFTRSVMGLLEGPTAALFILGLYVSVVGTKGAVVGGIVGTGFISWWYLGSMLTGTNTSGLPLTTENCTWLSNNGSDTDIFLSTTDSWMPSTMSSVNPQTQANISDSSFSVKNLYSLSPIMYSPLGFIITTLISVVIGLITKRLSKGKKTGFEQTDPEAKDVMQVMLQTEPGIKETIQIDELNNQLH